MLKSFFLKGANATVSRWVVLLIDISIVLQTFFLAYLVRFNFVLNFQKYGFLSQIPLIAILAMISFLLVGSHKGTIRHTGIKDAINVFYGVSILFGIMFFIVLVNRQFNINLLDRFAPPLSVIIPHYLLNIVLLISSRLIFKGLIARL